MTDLTTQIADIIRRTLNNCGYNDKDVPGTATHVAAVLVAELQLQQESVPLMPPRTSGIWTRLVGPWRRTNPESEGA